MSGSLDDLLRLLADDEKFQGIMLLFCLTNNLILYFNFVVDKEYMEVFVMTHRYFISSLALFDWLVKRFFGQVSVCKSPSGDSSRFRSPAPLSRAATFAQGLVRTVYEFKIQVFIVDETLFSFSSFTISSREHHQRHQNSHCHVSSPQIIPRFALDSAISSCCGKDAKLFISADWILVYSRRKRSPWRMYVVIAFHTTITARFAV
jgi:hypothetical protein